MTNNHPARANLMTRAVLATAAAVSLPFAVAQQPTPAKDTLLQRLERIEISANFVDASLSEWTSYLAQLCSLNIVIDNSAAALPEERTTLVGLKLPKTSVRRVLGVIQALTDLHWQCEGDNLLRISSRPRANASTPNELQAKGSFDIRINGAVPEPGLRRVPRATTLLQLLAGSMTLPDADLAGVSVTRTLQDVPKTTFFDVEGMLRTGATEQNVLLQRGDIVTIPRKPPVDLPPLTLRPGSKVRFFFDAPAGFEKLNVLEEPQRVQRDGTIFVPFVGNIVVSGKDRVQTADLVMAMLKPVLAQPLRIWARFD